MYCINELNVFHCNNCLNSLTDALGTCVLFEEGSPNGMVHDITHVFIFLSLTAWP